MDTLQILYDNKIQHSIFLERKIQILNKFTVLVGPKLSGKSYLIYDYIQNNNTKEYLYIDLDNLKDLEFKAQLLQNFINKNNIKILILENFDYSFSLPNVESIIISSSYYKKIDNFSFLIVMPLDFEEYLSFDNKHQNTTNSFNSFLKYGNLAQIINFKDENKQKRNKEIVSLSFLSINQKIIFELLIKYSAQNKSVFWLYTILKKKMKISKDYFYKSVKQFEHNNSIIFISKYNSPKAVKKLYCYNHAFIDTVTYNKNFSYVFETMVFLELFTKYNEIFYSDYLDFYIPSINTVIMSIAFYNTLQSNTILPKLLKGLEELQCTKIYIVSVSVSDKFYLDNISCEVMPFYEWALVI